MPPGYRDIECNGNGSTSTAPGLESSAPTFVARAPPKIADFPRDQRIPHMHQRCLRHCLLWKEVSFDCGINVGRTFGFRAIGIHDMRRTAPPQNMHERPEELWTMCITDELIGYMEVICIHNSFSILSLVYPIYEGIPQSFHKESPFFSTASIPLYIYHAAQSPRHITPSMDGGFHHYHHNGCRPSLPSCQSQEASSSPR